MVTPDLLEPLRLAVQAVLDKKGFQVVVLDVSELTSYTDGFVLCSAANLRQVGAIADEVGRRLRDQGRRPLHVEGTDRSEWMLLDYGDFVVHLFTEDKRSYYALDGLWADAPHLGLDELGVEAAEAGAD
jgi:ribosome-associated protein